MSADDYSRLTISFPQTAGLVENRKLNQKERLTNTDEAQPPLTQFIMQLEFIPLRGPEIEPYKKRLASLRIEVFREYPYLYDGSLDYEQDYLKTYFQAEDSFAVLVRDVELGRYVAATTSIRASEEVEAFKKPFQRFGFDPHEVFYFAESVVLTPYRNLGIGKEFFKHREAFARRIGGIRHLAFCAVVRPDTHQFKPPGYRDLSEYWSKQGFFKAEGLITQFAWKDVLQDAETTKTMQFYMKKLT
ncbi:MAG: GNAT family N-acetyltransferase [Cyclobacteriaceae bacterium]|nr:GNAT family N-acetyltransferase [Cyclobacteriaceae bacterium]